MKNANETAPLTGMDREEDLEQWEFEEPRPRGWAGRFGLLTAVALLMLVFFSLVFWRRMVVTVHVGEEAVLWRRSTGTELNAAYLEGTHVIFPWDAMYVYDVRISKVGHTAQVLSSDGLNIGVDLAIQYHPVRKALPYLHQSVGPDYVNKIVVPEVVTAVRQVVGRYRPQELYTISTNATDREIVSIATERILDNFIELDNVLIVKIQLPAVLEAGIQKKLAQEQEALEYVFRVQKEKLEADRKDIEAKGIRNWAAVIKELPPQVLQFKGIEATLELAKSPNSKVIVVGAGKDGLPLMLNSQ